MDYFIHMYTHTLCTFSAFELLVPKYSLTVSSISYIVLEKSVKLQAHSNLISLPKIQVTQKHKAREQKALPICILMTHI